MSQPNCDACNELREYAPEFVLQGVTENVATSLENNTGLNPNLTVLHTDCEDLHDVNDCLIGRMTDEVEAYDVCDWKDFMKKFLGNLYETLKAMIAAICGLWKKTDRLCESVDHILNLIGGDCITRHYGQRTSTWYQRVTSASPSIAAVCPYIASEFREGAGCEAGKKLNVWHIGWGDSTESLGPCTGASVTVQNLSAGDELATFRKSDIVPEFMTEEIWNRSFVTAGNAFCFGYLNDDTLLYVQIRGYDVIDGVEYHSDLKTKYGPGVVVLQVRGFVGPSRSGVVNGWINDIYLRTEVVSET